MVKTPLLHSQPRGLGLHGSTYISRPRPSVRPVQPFADNLLRPQHPADSPPKPFENSRHMANKRGIKSTCMQMRLQAWMDHYTLAQGCGKWEGQASNPRQTYGGYFMGQFCYTAPLSEKTCPHVFALHKSPELGVNVSIQVNRSVEIYNK